MTTQIEVMCETVADGQPMLRPHGDDKILRTEDYMQANRHETLSIGMLADRVGMRPRNFIRRFKAATGHMPGAYMQTLRIAAAKELLTQSAEPIHSICLKVGYEDVAFFRSLFKRHTGLTPSAYRARIVHTDLRESIPAAG